jgi:hypothetical protein
VINALAPGQDATADQMGDASCEAGGSDFTITAFGKDELDPITVGEDGMLTIDQIPVTTAETGPHILTETLSGATAEFNVEPDTVTRLIVLNYELDSSAFLDLSADDEAFLSGEDDLGDVSTIDSGEDLANTGTGPGHRPIDGGTVLMLGATGLFLLAVASRLLRRAN